MARVDPTDGRVDVVVLTPGFRMGEEDKNNLKVRLFIFETTTHNSQFYSNISLIYMQKTIGHEPESVVYCHTR